MNQARDSRTTPACSVCKGVFNEDDNIFLASRTKSLLCQRCKEKEKEQQNKKCCPCCKPLKEQISKLERKIRDLIQSQRLMEKKMEKLEAAPPPKLRNEEVINETSGHTNSSQQHLEENHSDLDIEEFDLKPHTMSELRKETILSDEALEFDQPNQGEDSFAREETDSQDPLLEDGFETEEEVEMKMELKPLEVMMMMQPEGPPLFTGVDSMTCPVCGIRKETREKLQKHLHVHDKVVCRLCEPPRVMPKIKLRRHVRMQHSTERPYRCQVVDCKSKRGFTIMDGLTRHMKELHGSKDTPCPNCDSKFASKGQLRKHRCSSNPAVIVPDVKYSEFSL